MRFVECTWSALKRSWPALLVATAIIVLAAFWHTASKRPFTDLETFFWQLFGIAIGAVGTFYGGRKSAGREAQETAREIVKSHARPAFRQLLSLRSSLLQQSLLIESSQDYESLEDHKLILSELAGFIYMQQLMVANVLGGWEDIVPEEVEELRKRLSPEKSTENG